MPTEVIKVIDTAGGGDYTSMQAALLGEARNLVTADQIAVLEFTGGRDYGGDFYIRSPWVTSPTHYIHIRPHTESQRATSIWSNAKYYIERRSFYYGFQIERNNVIWEGMQVDCTSQTLSAMFYFNLPSYTNGFFKFFGCHVKNGKDIHRVYQMGAGNKIYVKNCILHGNFSTTANVETYAYNNTLRIATGWYNGSTVRFKNCIMEATSQGFYNFHADSQNNISNIAGNLAGDNSQIGTVSLINKAAGNYGLLPGESFATGAGADLSSDPNLPVLYDINLIERAAPDTIGAFYNAPLPEEEEQGSVRSRFRRWRKYWRGWRRFS